MSTVKRKILYDDLIRQIRQFIAGTILFNQKVADQAGFRLTDMQCMNVLELLGPSTPKQLAEHTGLTTGGVTVMLDRLEKAGIVRRAPHPTDRRSILVSVNPKKVKAIHAHYDHINQATVALFSEFPEHELQAAAKFLARLNAVRIERGPL